jgi:hypothetical protein
MRKTRNEQSRGKAIQKLAVDRETLRRLDWKLGRGEVMGGYPTTSVITRCTECSVGGAC